MDVYKECYFTNSDGLSQYYRDYAKDDGGEGEVMLCMPGLTRNSRDFAKAAIQLRSHFRVICVEQRGRGKSAYDSQPERYVPPVYVKDMFALIEHLKVDSVHVFGTSLGGLMAMMMQV